MTAGAILDEDALAALAGDGLSITVPADITAEAEDGTCSSCSLRGPVSWTADLR